ncbi:VOC family protein [Haloarchaeobius litoreus]|uniref:VOC family protein n=1 Tax=Haloarchaeobius litoreus TaxID=755306 RepID=A0ABD6DJ13_9EURY|nr:VOC family protein [Haloarchaeobius litoreus]
MTDQSDDVRVEGIDHVECYVPDRREAAEWYRKTLGLETNEMGWESYGPLMVTSDAGATNLALFEGDPSGAEPGVGFHRVAFRIDGEGFFEIVDRLTADPTVDVDGRDDVRDHTYSFSVYFSDPYGNPFEVTTYEYAFVEEALSVDGPGPSG